MSPQSSQVQNSSTNQNSNYNNAGTVNPWGVQVPYLTNAFQTAGTDLSSTTNYTPDQLALYSSMLSAPTNNMGIPTSSANAGSSLSATGVNATNLGVNGLSNYNPFSTNNTNALTNGTNAFVSGLNIPATVAADMVPAEQAAAYGLSPQIDQSAAGSGNSNSSRDAIEHGILGAQLGQQANALTQQLTTGAYNTGAGLTESQLASNNQNALSALQGLSTTGVNAAGAGTNANSAALSDLASLYGIGTQGATGQNTDPFQALDQYYNIIGGNSWGSSSNTSGNSQTQGTGTQTTQYNPSQMNVLGGWLNMAGSLL